MAMAAPVRFGQIVWAEMADANGIRKLRPAVVVTPSDRLQESGPFEVVAVTSQVPQPLPDDHVLLPWHSQGHPRTGLNRKCAAVCTWLARISPSDIKGMAGVVPVNASWRFFQSFLNRSRRPSQNHRKMLKPGRGRLDCG
jgi:hypothetical protein